MGRMFEDLKEGLTDAIEDAKSKTKKLKRNSISIEPLIDYKPQEIKRIRRNVGMTQSVFANYLGVSTKTVEAWESGINKPAGSSKRLITLLDRDDKFAIKYPFVTV